MKRNILRYAVVALIASAATFSYAQEIYGDYDIFKLGKEFQEWGGDQTVFIGDESTTEIFLPNIESIGYNVCLSAPNIKTIRLGGNRYDVEKIYMYLFGHLFTYAVDKQSGDVPVTTLTSFEMYNPGWCEYPFSSWWDYPSQLTFIPYGVGSGCVDLERVILPKRAQCIISSFDGCTILPTVTLPECAGYIGNSFNDCASLRDIRVRSGYVTEIGNSFGNLPEDAVIYVPKGFKETYENSAWGEIGRTIAEDSEYDCGYTPEQLPKRGVTFIGDENESIDVVLGMEHYHFEGFDEDGEPLFYSDAAGEKDYGLPFRLTCDSDGNSYNIVGISDYALCGNNAQISKLELPATVEHIGAFVGSHNEALLIMPNSFNEGLKTIGRKAFSYTSFRVMDMSYEFNNELTLPSTLESIGEGAFDRHSGNLTTIRCAAAVPPVCGDARVFGDKSRLELVVPEGAYDLYYDAPVWRAFSRITEDASLNSVDSIMADIEGAAEAEYYTLDGRRVDADALTPGIYVVRRGVSVSKTLVR